MEGKAHYLYTAPACKGKIFDMVIITMLSNYDFKYFILTNILTKVKF